MIPSFLITFREVIEASLIVATILGVLVKFGHKEGVRTTIFATIAASLASIALIALGSLFGLQMQKIYTGKLEGFVEGFLMIVSAVFITWAVFFLHKSFSRYKIRLLKSVQETVEREEQRGLFILVFSAVFREGFEIALFLLTIYFSSNPISIFIGFTGGAVAALLISLALFASLIRLPLYKTFRVTSILLILFAAGMLTRGVQEFTEIGMLPEIGRITFAFVPLASTFMGSMIQALFGITKTMNVVQLGFYLSYTALMSWMLFFKRKD